MTSAYHNLRGFDELDEQIDFIDLLRESMVGGVLSFPLSESSVCDR